MPLATGEKLGPYEILAPIGAGGMGEVYRARDTRLGREVAIKVSAERFSERMEREARTIAALNHPHIATLHDVGEHAGSLYLAMEFVKGAPLKGPYPVKEAIGYAIQVAEGLAAAHEAGVVHRDLKPANILVTEKGSVKILDFGLAKLTEKSQGGATAATQTMAFAGTPGYLSPEQLQGKPADSRSDIFAFGCILYELVSGRRAFPGDTLAAALAATAMAEPKPLEGVPEELERAIRLCLRKDPERRLQNIGDARIMLEDLRDDPMPKAAGLRTAGSPWSSPAWAVVAAAACLIAAGLAVIHFREKQPAPPEVTRFQIRLPDNVKFSAGGTCTLSPDGRHLAFSAVADDQPPRVWIQDLDALEARPLQGTFTGPNPPPFFWSPDSRFVVYSENSPKLAKADVMGGPVQYICEKPGPPIGGSWNQGDVIVFGSPNSGLWRVPAVGGKPVPLTTLDSSRNEREHELPSFLPDGKHFIYLRVSRDPDQSGIYIGSLDDPPERQSKKRLLAAGFGAAFAPSADGRSGNLLFLRDGTLMAQPFDSARLELSGSPSPIAEQVGSTFETGYFSVSPRALAYRTTSAPRESQFTWYDSQGKAAEKVGDPGHVVSVGGLRLSPDGTHAAYAQSKSGVEEADLWLLDLARGTSTRFTFGNQTSSISPVWSPDGAEIVFASNRDGAYNLYRKPANGSREEELLLKTNENKRPLDWSRDGRYLFYATSDTPTFIIEHIWMLPMQGDRTPKPFQNTRFDESRARFSPDGHWVAYDSAETGRHEVYVREFQPSPGPAGAGGKWMISKDGGVSPQWRGDGKELIYRSLGNQVMSVGVDTSRSFQAGAPRELFRLPAGSGLLPTADFKRFLTLVPLEQTVPQSFTVMLNWTSAIKSR
jgi:Tol biopolymer transport system component/predicted Ser/Thr protein kinase